MASGIVRVGGSATQILGVRSISATGSISLSDNVNNYSAICFFVSNSSNDWKPYYIPTVVLNGNSFDLSFESTDSTGYYVIMHCTITNTALNVTYFKRGGYTSTKIMMYGIK